MKLLDDTTSQVFLVPSVVLMEQAAAGVVRELVAYAAEAIMQETVSR